jgi:hypothetical protein
VRCGPRPCGSRRSMAFVSSFERPDHVPGSSYERMDGVALITVPTPARKERGEPHEATSWRQLRASRRASLLNKGQACSLSDDTTRHDRTLGLAGMLVGWCCSGGGPCRLARSAYE